MNKLAQGGTGLAVFAVGVETFAAIMNERIMFPGAQRWHIQGLAQDGVAAFGGARFT